MRESGGMRTVRSGARSRPAPGPATGGAVAIELPGDPTGPLARIGRRMLLALAMVFLVAALTYVERDGFTDPVDGRIGVLDAFYYSTVTVTTTGYGDIRPVSDGARLVTTLLVTPARVLFLIVLVGTTLEILAERTRTAYRVGRWRRGLNDHTIVCGYGTKGRAAIATLLGQGTAAGQIVAIDRSSDAIAHANAAGLAGIAGDASSQDVLREAEIGSARAIVVAVDRDDSAVLITLTAREQAPKAAIAASVREEENVHLLHQSGADTVIASSGTAGRMLGMATHTPGIATVLEDLLLVGEGLDIVQEAVSDEEAGPIGALHGEGPVVAVMRAGRLLRFDDPAAESVVGGDTLIRVQSRRD